MQSPRSSACDSVKRTCTYDINCDLIVQFLLNRFQSFMVFTMNTTVFLLYDIRKRSDVYVLYLLAVTFLSFSWYHYKDTRENLESVIFLVAYL
jgi:fructosamine-3-kinase